MENRSIIKPFSPSNSTQDTRHFFLDYILKARLDLKLGTGLHDNDQEINVYLAGLLASLVSSDLFLRHKEYVSAFDVDVRKYLDGHPGLRTAYTVYRDNADYGLVFRGVFCGYEHPGSYQKIVLPGCDEAGRIALYYELAASALAHLQGKRTTLVPVLNSIAEFLPEVVRIIERAAGRYFEILERISEGSLFHLEQELDTMDTRKRYEMKLDEFLEAYSAYKAQPSEEGKQVLLALANECSLMNERFKFDSMEAGK